MTEGAVRRARMFRVGAAAAGLALAVTLGPVGLAQAEVNDPAPTPNSQLAPVAPTLDAPRAETTKNGRADFAGTKPAGTDVHLLVRDDPTPYCQTGIGQRDATSWTCTATNLPSGLALPVTARTPGTSLTSETRTIDVLNPPALRGASSGVITGTSFTGATVSVTTSSGSRCTVIPSTATTWSCVLNPVPASGPQTITATQETEWSDGPSAPRSITVVIDSTEPAAPIISTPRPGARVPIDGTTYSGRGETGATVDVYQSVNPVCSAVVRDGAWSCRGAGLKLGQNTITALQMDAAGNVGPWAEVTVEAYDPAAAELLPPTSTPTESGRPSTPQPSRTPAPAPDPSATAEPTDPGSPSESPEPDASDATPVPPQAGPSPPSGADRAPQSTGWDAPSAYGSALAPLPAVFVDLRWLASLGVAIGIIILVVMPAILLRSVLGDRVPGRRARLTGRNRAVTDAADGPVNRWLVAGVCLIGAAGLVAVSLRVEAQENFLRLLLATTFGLAVVNGVGVVAMAHAFRRFRGTVVHVRIAPAMLLLTAAAALLSRIVGLVPPLIVGQMLGFRYAEGTSEAERTRVALVSAGTLTLLGVASWGMHSTLRSSEGFWAAFASEVFSTVTLAGLASAVIALLPLGRPLGRSLLHGVLPVRLGASVVVLTIASAALASTTGVWAPETLVPLTVTAVGFASVSVAVWLWMRFVEPQR
jgi:hypothetical protein